MFYSQSLYSIRIIVILLLLVLHVPFISVSQKLELWLYPSFHNYSKMTFDLENSSSSVQLEIYQRKDTSKIAHMEKQRIDPSNLSDFKIILKKYVESQDSSMKIQTGLDGISITGNLNFNDSIYTFSFWSPQKETENHVLLKSSIELLRKNLTDKNSKQYIRSLKRYLK